MYAGHRRVRDGARVALKTIPGLLRFDVHPRADCFSFVVRNLSGRPPPPGLVLVQRRALRAMVRAHGHRCRTGGTVSALGDRPAVLLARFSG